MKKYMLIPIIMALLFACSPVNETSRISIGEIIDVDVIPTSFNEEQKVQIKTKTRFVVVYGHPPVAIGAQAYIITYDRGPSYFTWDGHNLRYKIWGNIYD
jgi:hypothetical protein